LSLLDRLNLFKRVKEAEEAEAQLFKDVDDLITGVETILETLDRRTAKIDELNARIHGFELSRSGVLDMIPDLDLKGDGEYTA